MSAATTRRSATGAISEPITVMTARNAMQIVSMGSPAGLGPNCIVNHPIPPTAIQVRTNPRMHITPAMSMVWNGLI